MSWPGIIWREWRHSEDEEYARHLFNLVRDLAVDWKSTAMMALFGTLYGVLGGYLLGLVAANWNSNFEAWTFAGLIPIGLAWVAGVSGGLIGLLAGRRLPWQVWLGLLTPNSLANKMGEVGEFNIALVVGWVARLAGFAFPWAVISAVAAGVLLDMIQRSDLLTRILADPRLEMSQGRKILASAVVGGLGFLIAGIVAQGDWVSIGFGLITGLWFGLTWGSLALGILLSWLGVLFGFVIFGFGAWLPAWLGLVAGFGLGLLPNIFGRGIDFANAYKYRAWYTWWRGQPSPAGVEAALRLATTSRPQSQQVWHEPLHRLEQQREQPGQPDRLVAALKSRDWTDRFTAWHGLIALGREAAESLQKLAAAESGRWQEIAIWLLAGIEQDTTRRLAWRIPHILCPHCLTRFGPHQIDLSWGISFTCYGCRLCGQSREFLERVPQVVAVLDEKWGDLQEQPDNQLRVNWLKQRRLFDFDQVEIIQATDEEVERFAVQVGNDTDPFRRARYQAIACLIEPGCHLSANTLRILQHTFGQVEHKQRRKMSPELVDKSLLSSSSQS